MAGVEISGKTRLLALIGHPVGHSLSPAMHNASFATDGLDYAYVALDVEPENLPAAVRGAAALGLRGFNVTMPHKRAMVPLVDTLDEAARLSEAVNTVVIEDGELRGHNTDGAGLVEACREAGVRLAGAGVTLLGAGGAAASVAVAFRDAGVGALHISNRDAAKAEVLAAKLRATGGGTRISAGPAGSAVSDAAVVVNATSLGMRDGDPLPVSPEHLSGDRTVIDTVYRPGAETDLVQEARARGATVVAGQRMLLYQGVMAQRLWTGHEPNVAAMDRALA